MWRYVILIFVSTVLGSAVGAWYVGRTTDAANLIGLGAQIIREDTVLLLLEGGKGDEAKRIQTEYLKVTMTQAIDPKVDWPPAVQQVLDRRRPLLSGQKP